MLNRIREIKNHVYFHRAKYTALVTIPVTCYLTTQHFKPYMLVARDMALFLHDHELGQKFLDLHAEVQAMSKAP